MPSLREIRNKYQEIRYKKKGMNNVFSKYIYSVLATPLVKLLLPTRITANQVTASWVVIGFVACLLLSRGSYSLSIVAQLLLQLHIVLDYVDGPIARAKNNQSLRGIYIERIGHDLINTFYFYSIAIGSIAKGFDPGKILIFGFFASFGYFFYKHTRRMKIYCSLLYSRTIPQGSFNIDRGNSDSVSNAEKKVGLLRDIYRKSQIVWEPVFFIAISLPLAIFDLLYVIPIFYGITYPLHFLASYIYQSRISDRWVEKWLKQSE